MQVQRTLSVEDRVFTLSDLIRIAKVFERQIVLAKKAKHHFHAAFEVGFNDGTSLSSESADVLSEEALARPAKPMGISFTFFNHEYRMQRYLSFTVSHGSLPVSIVWNRATIKGGEKTWVDEQFLRLKEAIDASEPQKAWPKQHPRLLHCTLIGGFVAIVMLMLRVFDLIVSLAGVELQPVKGTDPLRDVVGSFLPVLAGGLLFLLGTMAAFWIGDKILAMWPCIELDIGPEHLKLEKRRRAILRTVLVGVGLSVLANLIWIIVRWSV